MKSTTIIPNLTWGNALELFQSHGNIRVLNADSDKFKSILDAAGLPYIIETDSEKQLTSFKLKQPTNEN